MERSQGDSSQISGVSSFPPMVFWIPFLIFFVFFSPLLSQEENPKKKFSKPFTSRKDIYGRRYLEKWNGEIRYIFDQGYSLKVPHISELRAHYSEANGLDSFHPSKSLELRKNLEYCFSILPSEMRYEYESLQIENMKSLRRLASYLLRPDRNPFYGSRNLCNTDEGLSFHSESTSLRAIFPLDLNYYPFENENTEISEGVHTSLTVFYKTIIEQDFDWKTSGPEELYPYMSGELKIPNDRYFKFIISESIHPSDLPDKNFLVRYWDSRRGLTASRKKAIGFERKAKEEIYEVSWNGGSSGNYLSKEIYLPFGKKGLAIFWNYPDSKKEEGEKIWNLISPSLEFRGRKVLSENRN
ncbi:MAG: hypothetical protein KDK54_06040 [Leptospiraceae bacterium]|nr:hypothetical protein [Leptospiraceae bacterium]